jgi:hypothetical protein
MTLDQRRGREDSERGLDPLGWQRAFRVFEEQTTRSRSLRSRAC